MTLRNLACMAVLCGLAPAALGDIIVNDTYIDSYDASAFGLAKNTDVNYGGSAATKVVVAAGSDSFPLATSTVRSFITLPDSFWASIGDANVASATVTFRVRNFNNGAPFTRTVGIYPMQHVFTAGNGSQPTVPGGSIPGTMGGTQNLPGAPVGADWFTYNGAAAWTPGGQYDALHGVDGVIATGSATTLTWDITGLINDPLTRFNIQNFGLLIKINDDTNFPASGQQFLSFYSYEGALTQANPSAFFPVVNFTPLAAVPEPGSLILLATGTAALLMRRKKEVARV